MVKKSCWTEWILYLSIELDNAVERVIPNIHRVVGRHLFIRGRKKPFALSSLISNASGNAVTTSVLCRQELHTLCICFCTMSLLHTVKRMRIKQRSPTRLPKLLSLLIIEIRIHLLLHQVFAYMYRYTSLCAHEWE